MELELDGKVALVAGASRGIGLAIARAFVREGASVVLVARNAEGLERARVEVGGDAIGVVADMGTENGIALALAEAVRAFDAVDAVVANVGSGRTAWGWDVGRDGWQQALDVNFLPSVLLARAALPFLVSRGGSFTAISSITAREALDAPVTYAAAKAALEAAVKGIARLVAADGVRVNAIAPGNVLVPGGGWAERLESDGEGVRRYIDQEVPMRRFATPEEIADSVVYLASARASFVTGAVLVVDGGQTRSS
jgi:3-oxoacyl-[acyl-carrier protein] reductase